MIYVAPHPNGCTFFTADGRYRADDGQEVELFRTGDVFWRNGTSSERMTQSGLEEVIARRIAAAKQDWMAEQSEIRRHELAELQTGYANRDLIEAPLGSVSVDMDSRELGPATAELLRKPDEVALTHLLNEAEARARALIGRDEVDTELGALLDKLACMGATFLMYNQRDWLDRVIALYGRIYSTPLGQHDAQSFGYATRISSTATAPRVWLQILERLFGLGALAVRREDWTTIRTLTLQHPARLTDYDRNWIRHAITMVSRADHLSEQQVGRTIDVSLLSLARIEIAHLECLRPDGIAPDDDQVLTSLAEFDLLWNIVAVVNEDEASGRTFYPSFARVYHDRVQPIANRLLNDNSVRRGLEVQDDRKLAFALKAIGEQAEREGWRYNGFDGWRDTPVGQFIAEHMPTSEVES